MTDQETKDKLIQATLELLDQGEEADKLTVRKIAQRAEVGIGLINYHFSSKDNLLFEAVGSRMGEVAEDWYQPFAHSDVEPLERLKRLFIQTAEVIFRFPKLSRIGIRHVVLEGDFSVPQLILPLMREIYGGKKDERQLRLIAYQLVSSFQLAFLRSDDLRSFAGYDISEEKQRNEVIEILIDNIFHV